MNRQLATEIKGYFDSSLEYVYLVKMAKYDYSFL